MTERILIFAMGVLTGFLLMLFISEDAEAKYTPAVAVQEEAGITCGSLGSREQAFATARQLGATTIRINAIENMNPFFNCDPVGAVRAVAAAGFRPHVTVVGSPAYAKQLAQTVGPLVGLWSVWNESNHPHWWIGYMAESGGMPGPYRDLYVRMRRVLRRYDPGSRILIGELAPHNDTHYLDKVARRRGRPLRADGIAVHAYRWDAVPEERHPSGMRGYLEGWRKAARKWARERRLCRPVSRGRSAKRKQCRPVPIYVTEAGYLREARGVRHLVFDSPTTADRLVRSWRVACRQKVKQMFHYQLLDNGQPEWDTALIGRWGPRPEFEPLRGYLATAQGCRGTAGALGLEHGPPVVEVIPPRPVPIMGPSPLDALPDPGVPDLPVLVEPPNPPRLPDPPVTEVVEPPVVELPGPPEPAVEPPVVPEPAAEEPVPVPPIEEETP